MRLLAVTFLLGALTTVVHSACDEGLARMVLVDCATEATQLKPEFAKAGYWTQVDTSDVSQVRSACCVQKALTRCLRQKLTGECASLSEAMIKKMRAQRKETLRNRWKCDVFTRYC
ncbi:uncharacterized protein LOC135383905 [Ornithodoros turicata]|uniref:uncharacterized protein LOC135383905 n=1 Tax=Ornithodoros turicata TaxID=34597 RepID=UPI00313A131E